LVGEVADYVSIEAWLYFDGSGKIDDLFVGLLRGSARRIENEDGLFGP
jgi:hypothetical protein